MKHKEVRIRSEGEHVKILDQRFISRALIPKDSMNCDPFDARFSGLSWNQFALFGQ